MGEITALVYSGEHESLGMEAQRVAQEFVRLMKKANFDRSQYSDGDSDYGNVGFLRASVFSVKASAKVRDNQPRDPAELLALIDLISSGELPPEALEATQE